MIATGPRRNTHIVLGVQNTQGLDFAHFHKCCGAQLAQNPTEFTWHIYRAQTLAGASGWFKVWGTGSPTDK